MEICAAGRTRPAENERVSPFDDMKPHPPQSNPPTWAEAKLLIDAQFDELSETERRALESSLARNPGWVKCQKQIAGCLAALDHWSAPPASEHLADKVMVRVQMQSGGGNGHRLVLHQAPEPRRGFLLNWHELAAIAACLAVFIGVGTLTFSSSRGNTHRLLCGSNLGDIYRGTAMYAASFGAGVLPNAGTPPNSYWLQNASASAPVASNSRHQYLLLRTGLVPKPESFVCKARSTDVAMSRNDVRKYNDFPQQNMCSYDAQNMTGPFVSLYFGKRIPYQSDANPLFDGPAPGTDPQLRNSLSHDARGQNVLFSDGSVIFLRSPVVGKDNIWQAGSKITYEGNEAPTHQTDSFLVPGAKRDKISNGE